MNNIVHQMVGFTGSNYFGIYSKIKEEYRLTSTFSACTDFLCDKIAGHIGKKDGEEEILGIYYIKNENFDVMIKQLHLIEKRNGLRRTRVIHFETHPTACILIPSPLVFKYSVLVSLYSKLVRNGSYLKEIITDSRKFRETFWVRDPLLNNALLHKIIFSGKIKEIVKGQTTASGWSTKRYSSHHNIGIHYALNYPEKNLEPSQQLIRLNTELTGELNALPGL